MASFRGESMADYFNFNCECGGLCNVALVDGGPIPAIEIECRSCHESGQYKISNASGFGPPIRIPE